MVTTQLAVLDPLNLEENLGVDIIPAEFEPSEGDTGAICYRLTAPGIVRLYIRPKNRRFLAVRTLVDWEHREAGEHRVEWDGKDQRGNLLTPAFYCAAVQSQPKRGAVSRGHLPMDKEVHHEDIVAHGHHRSHAHTLHEPGKCHQLGVGIVSPGSMTKLSGTCRIATQISEDARGYGREVGHSARYYVDYMLLFEDKVVEGPATTWDWDTRNIPNGTHLLSVACCDHHDHMGSDSVVVEIDNG
jgi:hypothetical protein